MIFFFVFATFVLTTIQLLLLLLYCPCRPFFALCSKCYYYKVSKQNRESPSLNYYFLLSLCGMAQWSISRWLVLSLFWSLFLILLFCYFCLMANIFLICNKFGYECLLLLSLLLEMYIIFTILMLTMKFMFRYFEMMVSVRFCWFFCS